MRKDQDSGAPGCGLVWCVGTLLVMAAVLTAGCDKAQLLAPTRSTITVSAAARVLPSGGSTEVTAFVVEEAGTPVQNGTTVRFSTTLGRVEPVEVQTRNGLGVTTFFAENSSGIAEIRATSGGATGGAGGTPAAGGTTTTTPTNVVQITIGAAAVKTVTLRANPASVGPSGGSVELIANVVGSDGQFLPNVVVTFNTDQGLLSSSTATTNTGGEARTTLTTSQEAQVTATAGATTSTPAVKVAVRAGPIVSIKCTPASGTGNCGAVQASSSSNTAAVSFEIARPSGSSTLRTATIDFGDGTSQSLGNLAGGTATVTHTYSGPSGSTSTAYTATVQVTDINGESASTSTTVIVTPRPVPTPIAVNLTATESSKTLLTARWTFTAEVTGGGEGGTGNAAITSYEWDFGDGGTATTSGNRTSHVYSRDEAKTSTDTERRTVVVTVRAQDGRTATAREEKPMGSLLFMR